MRLLDALRSVTERLESSGVEDAFIDSELLVLHASGMERLAAYMENPEIDGRLLSRIRRLAERRAKGEPVQYILGSIEFLGLKIKVGKGVLIPRPETELLALEAVDRLTPHFSPRILDLCTGSGCIALSLARDFQGACVFGTDISGRAISFARKNAKENNISNVEFLKGHLFEPVNGLPLFDMIVSNPPYIKSRDIRGLQREIREWEPFQALDGGYDGLDFYRIIFSEASSFMKEKAKILVEIGFDQAEEVTRIAERSGLHDIQVKKDLAGLDRVLTAEK